MINDFVADAETYPNCFTIAFEHVSMPLKWLFEISEFRDDSGELLEFLTWLRDINARMVGFNNVGFDYPVLHLFIRAPYSTKAPELYQKAMAIIGSQDTNRFDHMVFPSDRYVTQIDLFKIYHFDNKAKATSLKALEFNMRMENISDLPFPVGTVLNQDQIKVLREYNAHDVTATKMFYWKSQEQIQFREELSATYQKDMLNHNDVKIGSEIFQSALENSGVQTYSFGSEGRQPRQTVRDVIRLNDAILPWINFRTPEFQQVIDFLRSQEIVETKGIFKDLKVTVKGLTYVFGVGGIHAAMGNKSFVARDDLVIESKDVASYYPNLSIGNNFYPAHLGQQFCTIYDQLFHKRREYGKGTSMNLAYKLALNGTYGKSNDKFSIFYDPLFTMQITLNGQLLLCLLAENLMDVPTVQIIMCNTDGLEYTIHPDHVTHANAVCDWWSQLTKLELEGVRYNRLWIRDVNNYVGEFTDGKVKLKGAYMHKREWHQDASALVIPKVAELHLVHGKPIRETLESWPDKYDFFSRVKVNRSCQLIYVKDGVTKQLENTVRYYVSQGGGDLIKVMPPMKGKTDKRYFDVESGWMVCPCNNVKDAVLPINYDYYEAEIRKLVRFNK